MSLFSDVKKFKLVCVLLRRRKIYRYTTLLRFENFDFRTNMKPIFVFRSPTESFLISSNSFNSREKMEPKDKGKCKVCSERGITIGCSKCQKRYHLNCLLPPLRKPPTINWACHSCRQMSARKGNNIVNIQDKFFNTFYELEKCKYQVVCFAVKIGVRFDMILFLASPFFFV